jgi:hypothetical protein
MNLETKALGFGLVLEELFKKDLIEIDSQGNLRYNKNPVELDYLAKINREIVFLYDLPREVSSPVSSFANVNNIISYFEGEIIKRCEERIEDEIESFYNDVYPAPILPKAA